jgi:hypothetical protein
MASRALMYLSLVLGTLYLPWWAVAAVAVAALALWSSYAVVFLAGIVMDLSYGAPVAALGAGFSIIVMLLQKVFPNLFAKKIGLKSEIPFAPFIIVALILVLVGI